MFLRRIIPISRLTHRESKKEGATSISPIQMTFQQLLQQTAAFDMTRNSVLTVELPSIPLAPAAELSRSTTLSRYRLHWDHLFRWNDFDQTVQQYWDTVPEADKLANVLHLQAFFLIYQTLPAAHVNSAEGHIRAQIDSLVKVLHNAAANGLGNAPRPTDRHSCMVRWDQGFYANQLAGIPDFVFQTESAPVRPTALVEVKNPWLVTPAGIDQVLDGNFGSELC